MGGFVFRNIGYRMISRVCVCVCVCWFEIQSFNKAGSFM